MSLWQTESWQKMLLASGQIQEYFVIELNVAPSPLAGENGERCGVQQKNKGDTPKIFVEKRSVSLGEFGLFMIGFEGGIDEKMKEGLQKLCAEENCLFAQIETLDYSLQPLSLEKGEDSGESCCVEHRESGENKYYKKFIPPYTAVIDLQKSEDEILSAMKSKGRYNIRLAEKKGVSVEEVEKSQENIKVFYNLMQETTRRDSFAGNTLNYYQAFLKQENAFLLFAFHEGEVIAAGIFIYSASICYYYYGASSSRKRNLMAPYLLQWSALSTAKARGYQLYDFLGVAGPDELNSPLHGVTDFKLKFTSDTRYVSESFLYIHKTWKYRLIQFLRYFKK